MAFKIGCLHVVVWFLLCLNKGSYCTRELHELRMKFSGKIIGGKPAELKQAKFMASIRNNPSDHPFGRGHFCGGALITRKYVMTAAHCFYESLSPKIKRIKISDVRVYFGVLKRTERNEHVLEFKVEKVFEHRNFNVATVKNDIGLLLLQGSVPKHNKFIQPISLGNAVPTNNCMIYGWGASQFQQSLREAPKELHFAKVEVFSFDKCKEALKPYMRPGMLCAGDWGGKTDACQGDSGGPLICNNTVVGITSWGIGCGTPKLPGVYSNVTHFKHWILHDFQEVSNIFTYTGQRLSQSPSISFPHSVCIILLSLIRLHRFWFR